MHDAVLVRVGERARDVAEDAERLGDGERPPSEPRTQALALHVRHRVVRQAVEVTRCEHGDDVRLLERRGHADLALEAAGGHGRRELRTQQLDDDLAPEAVLVGHEHSRHPAAAQLTLEGVAPGQRLLNARPKIRHGDAAWRGAPMYAPGSQIANDNRGSEQPWGRCAASHH